MGSRGKRRIPRRAVWNTTYECRSAHESAPHFDVVSRRICSTGTIGETFDPPGISMPDAVPPPSSSPPSPSRAIGPLFALFPFLRPYAGRWALAFLALVTSAGATLALPVAFKYLIDRGFASGDQIG